jgi:predicted nucleic acid-binding protein
MATLVFDSAPLSCFARASRLPMLEQLTEGDERVTTRAVLEEISEGVRDYAELQSVLELAWLQIKAVDGLEELRLFAAYARRLGAGRHNIGEASVLAWAEAHGAIAFTDDEVAVQIGRERGVRVQRTLALVARGVRRGLLTDAEAHTLVDELQRGGARFPFGPGEFIPWARQQGLLDKSRG